MRLYTKIDKRADKYYEVFSIIKSLSKQNLFFLKILVSLFFLFQVFVIKNLDKFYEVVSINKSLSE